MGKGVVVFGTSPFHDTAVAAGPFAHSRTPAAVEAVDEMEYRGFVTEVVPLQEPTELPTVVNDEGSEEV